MTDYVALLFVEKLGKLKTFEVLFRTEKCSILHFGFVAEHAMKHIFGFLCICVLKVIASYDSESSEGNKVEDTPFFDTIIISDIADIINEFQKMNFPFDAIANSESESDENIEDLLSEYQNYLDRAHNQRKTYLEKSKIKNKVPLIRHDKYAKGKTTNSKHDNYYYDNFFNPSNIRFPQMQINMPLDLIPISSKPKYISNASNQLLLKNNSAESWPVDKTMKEKQSMNILPTILNPGHEPIKSSCFCTDGQHPCKCNCKQCLIPLESFAQNHNDPQLLVFNKKISDFPQELMYGDKLSNNFEFYPLNPLNELTDNIMNIRVKVDIQTPKSQNGLGKYFSYKTYNLGNEPEDVSSKEYMSSINLPPLYFNIPVPIDLPGHKKSTKFNKHDNIHQIMIHKKKKSKFNNNKKHKKKIISFHNVKMTTAVPPTTWEEINAINNDSQILSNTIETITLNKTINLPQVIESSTIAANVTNETNKNDTRSGEKGWFIIVSSNKSEADKDDLHKMENSIEIDYTKMNTINMTTPKTTLRKKRDNVAQSESPTTKKVIIEGIQKIVPKTDKTIKKEDTYSKKSEKTVAIDTELLYWPNVLKNQTSFNSKNITTLILEGETKKTKLNITTDMIRHNRTIALEQAIFGNVDWDDVDTVVPTFISFIGKYIKGVLTFCSQTACHSINCEKKKCMHRTCVPKDRLNQKGHCIGSKEKDTEASLESIMDLPSNVVFEIVDILQDKMLGKLFGKATLCISSKCVTFVASKKNFLKSKCNTKELDKNGFCPYVKSVKIM